MNLLVQALVGVDTIVHIGAGRCAELSEYLAASPRRIFLFEANPKTARQLRAQVRAHANVRVIQSAVAGEDRDATLRLYSLAQLSSLREAVGLRKLYPGLRLIEELPITAHSVTRVLCELGWEDEAQACLVIDAPGEEFAILEAIVKHDVLRHIGSLVLYAPNAPLYEGARSQQESLELLNTCGFELLGESGNKGDVERIAVLKLNKWKQLSHRLQNECEALRKRLDEQNSEIDHLRRQLERIRREPDIPLLQPGAKIKQINEESIEPQTLRNSGGARTGDLKPQVENLQVADPEKGVEAIQEREESPSNARDKLSKIAELLEKQDERLKRMERSLADRIRDASGNAIRQIESLICIDAYLSGRSALPLLYGWSISADLAAHLVELIDKKRYDLIVEFGSGASTIVMASALARRIGRKLETSSSAYIGTEPIASRVGPYPQREPESGLPLLTAFEHQTKYLEDTGSKLERAGLTDIVDLTYAPLRDYVTPEGERFLYYACEEKLSELHVRSRGTSCRILVLVDGPPGLTCPYARYPALPVVLRCLPAHKFDIVIDDYNRQDEKEIVRRWCELLDDRGIAYDAGTLPFEKGAFSISIN